MLGVLLAPEEAPVGMLLSGVEHDGVLMEAGNDEGLACAPR